jgi:hypothetical protein
LLLLLLPNMSMQAASRGSSVIHHWHTSIYAI